MRRYLKAPLLMLPFVLAACGADNGGALAGPASTSRSALAAAGVRVIVVATGPDTVGLARAHVAAAHGIVHRDLAIVNALAVVLPDRAAAERLAGDPAVLRVDPDVEVYALGKPSCSPWPDCKNGGGTTTPPPPQVTPWGITRIGSETAWQTSRGAGVKVEVIDTGIDPTHPDLNVLGGINYTTAKGGKASAWADDNGHGTHVAGTIAALDNDQGVVGVAPDASLYACKALDRNGTGYLSDIISCLQWGVSNGMRVANMSLGATSSVQSFQDACGAAKAAGMTLSAAAGNSGDGDPATDNVEYPGAYASTIAVAATDDTDAIAYFSSDGAEVSLAGPGVDVTSTYKGGTYATLSGTSMATPHDTGAAAVLLGAFPGLSPDCVQWALESTATDLGAAGWDPFFGNGLIDLPAALAAAPSCPY